MGPVGGMLGGVRHRRHQGASAVHPGLLTYIRFIFELYQGYRVSVTSGLESALDSGVK